MAACDAGGGAHQLAGSQRPLQQPLGQLAGGADGARLGQRALELHLDLVLTQDHRVQPGRQPEHMPHGLGACVYIEVRPKLGGRDMVTVGKELYERLLAVGVARDHAADLDPVTGRDDKALVGICAQRPQRRLDIRCAKGQLLTHGDGADTLVRADNDQLCHVEIPS